jgi:hypothetical protein
MRIAGILPPHFPPSSSLSLFSSFLSPSFFIFTSAFFHAIFAVSRRIFSHFLRFPSSSTFSAYSLHAHYHFLHCLIYFFI